MSRKIGPLYFISLTQDSQSESGEAVKFIEKSSNLGPEDREDNELLMEDSKELAQSAAPPAKK